MRRAVLGLLLLPGLALAQPIEAPPRQVAFEALLREYAERSPAAVNDAARVALRLELSDRAVRERLLEVNGWVGNVAAIHVESDGHARLVVNLLRGTALVTNFSQYDYRAVGHPIRMNTPLHRAIAGLRVGDMVRIDGKLTCLRSEGRATLACPLNFQSGHAGALEQPLLLIEYRNIAPLRR